MNEDRERGLGSHRPSRAGHLGRNAFPGVRPPRGTSPGLFSPAPFGSHCGSRFARRGLGSHRPSGAGHLGRNAFPGVRFASPGLFSRAPSGSHCGSRFARRGLGSHRPSRAGHVGRNAFPGVRFASPGYSRALPPGAIDLCEDSDSGLAHGQEAFASSGLTRSRSSLEGLK
jgi:hypothetical protein